MFRKLVGQCVVQPVSSVLSFMCYGPAYSSMCREEIHSQTGDVTLARAAVVYLAIAPNSCQGIGTKAISP